MKVIVADDQSEVRSAIRLVLEHEGARIVAEPADVRALIEETARTRPAVVLMDWELPGLGERKSEARAEQLPGILAQLRAASPGVRVVAMSGRSGARAEAGACGADDFLSKSGPTRYLVALLERCALEGGEA